jgi:hypothetical protein
LGIGKRAGLLLPEVPDEKVAGTQFLIELLQEDAAEMAPYEEEAIECCRDLLGRRLLCLLHGETSWA